MVDEARTLLGGIDELIASHTNRHVDEWKASGKPVVGYFCHYAPVELMLAVGALPLRLRGAGSEDSSQADALMSGRVCTYVRHTMSLVLDGQYDFLDGAIALNTCDHVRRSADVFTKKTNVGFNGFVSVPRNPRESLLGYYRDELRRLLDSMAEHFGVRCDDDALREAIRKQNAVRDRLYTINRTRIEERPLLTGTESLAIHIASQVLPADVFLKTADELIEALKTRDPLPEPLARLVLTGAELDEPKYVAAIESQGALVVADRLCFGSRSVLDPIDENAADPLDAIARAYFFRPSCARMIGDFPARWDKLKQTVDESKADGVVFERLVFCDPWGAEVHNCLRRSEIENTFPILVLTREYGIVPTGQVRTRVQAFVEKLQIARARRVAEGGAA